MINIERTLEKNWGRREVSSKTFQFHCWVQPLRQPSHNGTLNLILFRCTLSDWCDQFNGMSFGCRCLIDFLSLCDSVLEMSKLSNHGLRGIIVSLTCTRAIKPFLQRNLFKGRLNFYREFSIKSSSQRIMHRREFYILKLPLQDFLLPIIHAESHHAVKIKMGSDWWLLRRVKWLPDAGGVS